MSCGGASSWPWSRCARARRLGAIVFQFAPWVQYGEEHFDHIARCAERLRDDLLAVEFRNKSWLNERTRDAALDFERRLGLVHVITDEPQGFANSVPPVWEVTNPKLAFVRFHGRNARTWQKATGSAAERFDYLYSEVELREFVEPIKQVAARAAATHVLFNNCRENKAQLNAADLARLLIEGGSA